jgi:hypothetical protein
MTGKINNMMHENATAVMRKVESNKETAIACYKEKWRSREECLLDAWHEYTDEYI